MKIEPLFYLGIDPSQRYKPYVYAALDASRRIVALGSGPLREILSYASGLASVIVSINGPQCTNQGLFAEANREQKLFPLETVKDEDMRLVEAEIAKEGVRITPTPARMEDCKMWVRRGFKLYAKLQKLGYAQYPLARERIYCESMAEAIFSRLIGAALLFEEATLEGRLQRQLILFEQKIAVKDAMSFFDEATRFRLINGILPLENIYQSGELNALACAYLAWMLAHKTDQTERLGDEREGNLFVPLKAERIRLQE
ncbi:MAG: hypothetical protein BGO78_09145 [Chloroflexi bacterium 44-23]|nr:MAG: hypothetical protein BGO78_09145 [Chloroflexi bacterium 44-23]